MIFHDFELAFCGYSNSGKTTLISKLISELSPSYQIGYIKANAHQFVMDRDGKDTDRMNQSGAEKVAISTAEKWATISNRPKYIHEDRQMFSDCEFVFVEGAKSSKIGKIVVVDAERKILDDIESGEIDNVIAYVGPWDEIAGIEVPYFNRDSLSEIKEFVVKYFESILHSRPLYGLVLAGGKSRRMGRDKALIDYHGKSQSEFYLDLLSNYCEKSFVSSRPSQWSDGELDHLPQIHDRFVDFGPMGGILSAMISEPEASWVVIACDLPFLKQDTIEYLINHRKPYKFATAYDSSYGGLPEPLCAIYEQRSRQRLFEYLGMGYQCPRKVLINSNIERLELPEKSALDNANDPDEYKRIHRVLSEEQVNG